MKTLSSIAAALLFTLAAASPAAAATITFDFVTTSAPTGGGSFTATTAFDSSLFDGVARNALPLAFSASLIGNQNPANNRTWVLGEVSFSQFVISTAGVLAFSALQATDTEPGFSPSNFLNGGATGFSSPVTIGGFWQQRVVSAPVPDHGATGTLLAAGLLVLLGRSFRSHQAAD